MSRVSKTPIGRVRGLGSAKSGTEHFWRQRVTAVANILLVPAFCVIVILGAGRPYEQALALVAHPLVAVVMILFVVSILVHMRLGMQVIIEDYLHDEGTRIAALLANTFFAIAIGIACIYSILKIGFGA
jgi:succinate dehydrogenase / fumarate reductase membrane anchor subunit